jgi:hypothetical protein
MVAVVGLQTGWGAVTAGGGRCGSVRDLDMKLKEVLGCESEKAARNDTDF